MNDSKNFGEEKPVPLDGLRREMAPPGELEQRVIEELAIRALLTQGSRRSVWSWRGVAAFAAIAIFFGGFAAGKRSPRPAPAANNLPAFILFLHEDSNYQRPAAGEVTQRVTEYGQWARDLRESGVAVSGTKLRDDVHLLLTRPDSEAAAQQPADAVAGYFIIRAKSLEEAVIISRKCPHLRYGGRIEIRQVDPV